MVRTDAHQLRTVAGDSAQAEAVKARFENGVLEVTVPVQEPKQTRRQIPIESAAPATAETSGKAA